MALANAELSTCLWGNRKRENEGPEHAVANGRRKVIKSWLSMRICQESPPSTGECASNLR